LSGSGGSERIFLIFCLKSEHCFQKIRSDPPDPLNPFFHCIPLSSAKWVYQGGFPNDAARDAYMTQHSDRDIAWVRTGKEHSGTAKNLQRRNM
jgi:hypothetical protein